MKEVNKDRTYYCSFCGKNNTQVKALIEGPRIFICNECVELCNYVLIDTGYMRDPIDNVNLWIDEFKNYNNY